MQAASRRELTLVAEAGDLEVFERIDITIAIAVAVGTARTVGAAAGARLAVLRLLLVLRSLLLRGDLFVGRAFVKRDRRVYLSTTAEDLDRCRVARMALVERRDKVGVRGNFRAVE